MTMQYDKVDDTMQLKLHLAELKSVLNSGYRCIVLDCMQRGISEVLIKTLGGKGVGIDIVLECIKEYSFTVRSSSLSIMNLFYYGVTRMKYNTYRERIFFIEISSTHLYINHKSM